MNTPDAGDTDSSGGGGQSVSGTAARLAAEFSDMDLPTITGVLLACGRDLAGAPATALPELVERLARQDLADLIADRIRGHRSGY